MIDEENIISDLQEGLSIPQIATRKQVHYQVIRRIIKTMDREWQSLAKRNGKKRQLDNRQTFNPVQKVPNR